jgi:hypothetical protein
MPPFGPEPFVLQFVIEIYKVHRTIILPFISYGYGIWPLKPRKGKAAGVLEYGAE